MGDKILIVGAGATGGYFGARLAQAGRDVTFLVRPARAEQLRAHGLRVASPHGDFSIAPTLASPAELGPFDVVLLGVKAFALEAAMEDFSAAVGPETMIVPMLNGMRHIDALVARFGSAPVLGGVCLVATEIDADGRIVQMTPMQQLIHGERAGGISPRVEALHALLQGAGFEATLSPDIMQAMWEKWAMLASIGAVNCLMRAPIGPIASVPGGPEFARALFAEACEIAAASGHPVGEDYVARQTAALTAKGSPLNTSMYRDLLKGFPVEVEHILGDLVARAAAFGVATPLLHAATVNLRVYQASR
jgi:2-dehydropantoate 2-reductase